MSRTQKLSFRLVGQLKSYEFSRQGRIRYLGLTTNLGFQRIKLTHESCIDLLRGVLSGAIGQGSWLEVTGVQKIKRKGHQKSFKAEHIQLAQWPTEHFLVNCTATDAVASPQRSKAKILVCQKSACRKRGSAHIQQMLEQVMGERDLAKQVCIKAVGCLKECSKGPNIVINKTRYCNVSFKDVVKLLDQHFAPQPQPIAAFGSSNLAVRLAEVS
jgi:(2Fe-2S) ferredoxin